MLEDLSVVEMKDGWAEPGRGVLEKIGNAPRCAALLDIWKVARGGRDAVAARSAIDPIVLAEAGLLPFVWILERDESRSYFYRLVGESLRQILNTPVRGRYLREIYDPDMTRMLTSHCDRVLSKGEISFTSGVVSRDGEAIYYARRILLPLHDSAGTARFLIGTVDHLEMGPDYDRSHSPRFAHDFSAFLEVESV